MWRIIWKERWTLKTQQLSLGDGIWGEFYFLFPTSRFLWVCLFVLEDFFFFGVILVLFFGGVFWQEPFIISRIGNKVF